MSLLSPYSQQVLLEAPDVKQLEQVVAGSDQVRLGIEVLQPLSRKLPRALVSLN